MAGEETTDAGTTEVAAAVSAPSGGGNKLILILTAVNVLATLGIAAVLVISFQKDAGKPSVADMVVDTAHEGGEGGKGSVLTEGGEPKHSTAHSFGKMVGLDQFTVNLATVGSVNPKFVRVNISVEVPSADTEAEMSQKMPQVKNTIIDLLNSKRPTDLATPEGRNYLKEEVQNALNSFLVTGKVKGVFFTNFALSG